MALTYQWYKDGSPISGATSATYTKSSAVEGDAGSYYCRVTNAFGSVQSVTVGIVVLSGTFWDLISSQNVTITSGEISSWKSTNEKANFTLDSAGSCPVVGTNLLNGYAPVRFKNKRITNRSSAGFITNKPRTYALLVNNVALDNTIVPSCLQYLFDETQQIGICANANNNGHWGIGNGVLTTKAESTVLSTSSSPQLLILTVSISYPYNVSLYKGSELIASVNQHTSNNTYLTLGCDAGNGNRGIGTVDIYEMLAYDHIISSTEIANLINYVNGKYVLSIT